MGTLQCQVCFITADAKTKEEAITKIDHAANSKKCSGKDELCNWYQNGIPKVEPDVDIDPKRPIEGIASVQVIPKTKKSVSKKDKK